MKSWVCFALSVATASSWAFDSGPHADVTVNALQDTGFSSFATKMVRLCNWLTDYYSNTGDHEEELALLHFDNLFDTKSCRIYWNLLTNNTRRAIQRAARAGSELDVLTYMGISLHAVQDFYTHSTWVETHPPANGNTYRTDTWFTNTPGPAVRNIKTGMYPQSAADPNSPTDQAKYHGSYTWGINHDSYSRPRFDEAYVFAYSATKQWVLAVKQWVEAVNPGFWTKLKKFNKTSLQSDLDIDLSYSYYVSLWTYDPGILANTDGRWKGFGTGTASDFGGIIGRFKARQDDYFTTLFKGTRPIFVDLLPGLSNPSGSVPAIEPLPVPVLNVRAVVVRTTFLSDDTFFGLDGAIPGDHADFFGKITIFNQEFVEPTRRNVASGPVYWRTLMLASKRLNSVPVHYELWDEDKSGYDWDVYNDDFCDINPSATKQAIDFSFNPANHACSGDINGVGDTVDSVFTCSGDRGNKATTKFAVTEYTVSEP